MTVTYQATQQKRRKSKVLGHSRNHSLKKKMITLLVDLDVGNVQCNKKGLFGHKLKHTNF